MRVHVTGIGIVSALGGDAPTTMAALLRGETGIRPFTLFDLEGKRVEVAATVAAVQRREGWSRTDCLALAAAREALGGLSEVDLLVVGGTTGGMLESEAALAAVTRDADAAVATDCWRGHPLSAVGSRLAETIAVADRRTVCSACSGGANAILLGAVAIAAGRAERVLVGGVDALCRLTVAGFGALNALDPQPCKPFDRRRAGLSLGEGAGFLLLESDVAARRRGADVIAELAGWATAAEAHHVTQPDATGATAAQVMLRAIASAGLRPEQIDYVNAHGTATPHNDAMEAQCVTRVLRQDVHLGSCKGAIGHTLGASGAIEAAVTALAIARGELPPTVGLSEPDPACPGNHLLAPWRGSVRAALSNAFGFGGTDTVLCFTQPGLGPARAATPSRSLVITGAAAFGPAGLTRGGATLAYTEPGPAPDEGPLSLPEGALDPMRARRMGHAAKMLTLAAGSLGDIPADAAVIVGSAFGSVGATGAFLRRLFERGARFASPMHFPMALPSALSSHLSIYFGLRGTAVSMADLAASGEAALLTAAELIAAGELDAAVTAFVEERSAVAMRFASPLVSGLSGDIPRSEGAGALLLESAEAAGARGAAPLALLQRAVAWQGEAPALPAPLGRAPAVILARSNNDLPVWPDAPRHVVAGRVGDHECAGGMALAAAVAAIEVKAASDALVLGRSHERRYAFVLSHPQRQPR